MDRSLPGRSRPEWPAGGSAPDLRSGGRNLAPGERPHMSLDSHIDQLKERHAALEARITDEDARPRPDSEALTRLKLEKLRLKEEMERLRTH